MGDNTGLFVEKHRASRGEVGERGADVGASHEKGGGLEFQVSSEVTCTDTPLASSPEEKNTCVTFSQGRADGLLLRGSSLIHTGPIDLLPCLNPLPTPGL